jgi:magnesium-transporting ATPase (P-type)
MCKDVGFTSFVERTSDTIRIDVQGKSETYQILKIIDFTSDRKRMSVIVKRQEDGKVINFIKGADMTIIPRINPNQDKEKNAETIKIMN